MVSASIYHPNGKMNFVCNQMYHNQISDQNRNICQRMNQMTTSREPGNLTYILDFPRQPYKVRKLAAEMMKTGVGLTQSTSVAPSQSPPSTVIENVGWLYSTTEQRWYIHKNIV